MKIAPAVDTTMNKTKYKKGVFVEIEESLAESLLSAGWKKQIISEPKEPAIEKDEELK